MYLQSHPTSPPTPTVDRDVQQRGGDGSAAEVTDGEHELMGTHLANLVYGKEEEEEEEEASPAQRPRFDEATKSSKMACTGLSLGDSRSRGEST